MRLRFEFRSGEDGIFASSIRNLKIIKQEIVKVTGNTISIKGFIHDKTVNADGFTINSKIVPIDENGLFTDVVPVDPESTSLINEVNLSVVNAGGETDEIHFSVITVANEPELDNVVLFHSEDQLEPVITYDVNDDTDYLPIETVQHTISLQGYFSGLFGVQVNCEVYTIDSRNNISRFIDSYSGDFIETEDHAGILSGLFKINDIKLIPGLQRIILRTLNPAGKKKEVKFDISFNVIEQKIEFLNYVVEDSLLLPFHPDTAAIDYPGRETFEVCKNHAHEYIWSFELKGRVITSNPVDFINFRSDNNYISFSKNDERDVDFIKVELDELGKYFSVVVNLKMNDKNKNVSAYFKIWPDSLQMAELSQNMYINFEKIFKDISPDFSDSVLDSETGKIDLAFHFTESIPAHMWLRLRFNHHDLYDSPIYIPLASEKANFYFDYSSDFYQLKKPLQASPGYNILEWWLYEDMDTVNAFDVESDTLLGKSGISDCEVFNFDNGKEYITLDCQFPARDIYYNRDTLASEPLQATFDDRGSLRLFINDTEITLVEYISHNALSLDLTSLENILVQGMNTITLTYKLETKNIDQTVCSSFKYDSVTPVVTITSVETKEDFKAPSVQSVTCEITEDNLKRVHLIYNDSVVNVHADITILSDNTYVYQWNNLDELHIIPEKTRTLYIEVIDITDKVGMSKKIEHGSWLYYDIDLSNNILETQVTGHDELVISGTDDSSPDYSGYWNEADNSFTPHLKYISKDLLDDSGIPLREDISENFDTEHILNSDRKYLMFEFWNRNNLDACDLAYQRKNEITKIAAITPVEMWAHRGTTTDGSLINTFLLDDMVNDDDAQLYSIVEGYETYENQYVGFAHEILCYEHYILVLESVDQNEDGLVDYRAVIIYDLLKPLDSAEGITGENDGSTPTPEPQIPSPEDREQGYPRIIKIIDFSHMQKAKKMKIYNDYLFLLCEDEGIVIYDISALNDPATPEVFYLNTIIPLNQDGEHCSVYDIAKNENYLFVAAGEDGIITYYATDLSSPHRIDEILKNPTIPFPFVYIRIISMRILIRNIF